MTLLAEVDRNDGGPATAPEPDALRIAGLDVSYRVRGRSRPVLRGLDLAIPPGGTFGLVGESGCGKSTAAMAAMRYLPRNGRIDAGRILVGGRDVTALPGAALRDLRRHSVSMVYQDPGRALNPTIRIGAQVAEVYGLDGAVPEEARARALAMLGRVRIADPASVMERYPHQLSGGMQQRVVIAMALAVKRELIVLDEPTTGLDATVEAEVLDLVETLRRENGTAVLFIGHNLEVIARMCAEVGVLYAGRLVEQGPTRAVFAEPRHPYTVGLLRCLPRRGLDRRRERLDTIPGFLPTAATVPAGCVFSPRCSLARDLCRTDPPPLIPLGHGRSSRCHFHAEAPDLPRNAPAEALAAPAERTAAPAERTAGAPLLAVEGLNMTFRQGRHAVQALRDIDLSVGPGETLGLVGESGSGKSTLARILLGLTVPDAGSRLALDGEALLPLGRRRDLASIQMVFQNPDSALNRAHAIGRIIGRALGKLAGLKGAARRERMLALTRGVQLADPYLAARPRQLSGGLKQRVAIARAFAGRPRLIVCDEPTSALDVSVQAAILNLLADLQAEQGVSYLFISHDLAVVRYVSDRIAVLYLGRLMEIGPADSVFAGPHHPYTEVLLSATPGPDGAVKRVALSGEIPSAVDPPSGCVFHTRCPRRIGPICDTEEPPLSPRQDGHAIRCHLASADLGREEVAHVNGTRPFDLAVRGGRAVLPEGEAVVDIGIRDGLIAAIGRDLGPASRDLDARDRLVLPGGVDTHCHMDQPPWDGMATADDLASGTLSALCGGTTTVVPFAMQLRGVSLAAAAADYRAKAAAKAHIDYNFHLIVGDPTPVALDRDLPRLVAEGCTSIKVYMTYDGLKLDDGELLRVLDAARALGVLAMVHAENDACVRWLTEKLVGAGLTAMRHHAVSRPALGDREAAFRAIALSEIVEVPILIAHVSAAGVVEEIRRAQARGVPILAETCPQYLYLSSADLDRPGLEGAKCVCTPPPRTAVDQAAVLEGLRDGTLSIFSSDHSPWLFTDKLRHGAGFHTVPNGLPGIETRLALLFSDAVGGGHLSLADFVERTSTAPARIFGLAPRKGLLAVGSDADIVLWDPERAVTITNALLHHANDHTPYEGRPVRGWPVTTIAAGEVLWHEGRVTSRPGRGRFVPAGLPVRPADRPQSWLR